MVLIASCECLARLSQARLEPPTTSTTIFNLCKRTNFNISHKKDSNIYTHSRHPVERLQIITKAKINNRRTSI